MCWRVCVRLEYSFQTECVFGVLSEFYRTIGSNLFFVNVKSDDVINFEFHKQFHLRIFIVTLN